MSFHRGTSVEQDSRFFGQHKKLLAKLSFPACFDQKVDLTKVKREVIDQWITERVTQLLGFEDDIVVSLVINLLEPKGAGADARLDPREMQLAVTGFLEKDAPAFMKELWELLLSAQAHPTGIAPQILEKKKAEMAQLAKQKQEVRAALDRTRRDVPATSQQTKSPPRDAADRRGRERDRRPPPVTRGRFDRSRSRKRSASRSRDRSRRRHRSPSRSPPRRRRSPSRSRSSRRRSSRRSRSRSLSRSPRRSGRQSRRDRRRSSSASSLSSNASSRSPSKARSRRRSRSKDHSRSRSTSRSRRRSE